MEFLSWWFNIHYIWALLLTPTLSFVWAVKFDASWVWIVLCVMCIGLKDTK